MLGVRRVAICGENVNLCGAGEMAVRVTAVYDRVCEGDGIVANDDERVRGDFAEGVGVSSPLVSGFSVLSDSALSGADVYEGCDE